MRQAQVYMHGILAGILTEHERRGSFSFRYSGSYQGEPISCTLPVEEVLFEFNEFPAFFDGLLPEGLQLEALLRGAKIDRNDYFSQLLAVGGDLVGAVTVRLNT